MSCRVVCVCVCVFTTQLRYGRLSCAPAAYVHHRQYYLPRGQPVVLRTSAVTFIKCFLFLSSIGTSLCACLCKHGRFWFLCNNNDNWKQELYAAAVCSFTLFCPVLLTSPSPKRLGGLKLYALIAYFPFTIRKICIGRDGFFVRSTSVCVK